MDDHIDTSLWVSVAKLAPIAVVAEYVQLYRKTVTSDRIFCTVGDPEGSDSKFELAVIERNDPFLNVLLSTCVTEANVALRLWEWSADISEKGIDVSSIRNSILGTAAIRYLLNTKSIWFLGSGRNKAVISVEEIASKADDESRDYLRTILANPYCKTLVGDCLLLRNDFEGLRLDDLVFVLNSLLKNPALNITRDSSDSPDIIHMDLNEGIRHVLTDAPTNDHWMWMLNDVLITLEPKAFSFSDQVLMDFKEKWLKFQPTSESDCTSTGLSAPEELISILYAKFGSLSASQRKNGWRNLTKVGAIETVDDKATFYGKERFSSDDLRKVVENDNTTAVLFWLSFNDTVINNPISRRVLMAEMTEPWLLRLYQQRIRSREQDNPYFLVTMGLPEQEDPHKRVAQEVEGLRERVDSLYECIKQETKQLSYLMYGVAFVVILVLITVN